MPYVKINNVNRNKSYAFVHTPCLQQTPNNISIQYSTQIARKFNLV